MRTTTFPLPSPRSPRPFAVGLGASVALTATVALLAAGCGDQSVAPDPLPASSEVYWELVLSQHAALMSTVAPYDTLRVTATPRNFEHVPLTGLAAPTYTSTRPDKVNVLADGTIVVIDTTAEPVAIVAALTVRNLKHADTLQVIAVDSAHPVVLDTFSIHPVAPDSAKFSISFDRRLHVRALAPGGTAVSVYRQDFPGIVPVSVISQSPRTIQILRGNAAPFGSAAAAHGLALGTSTLIASTVVFGVPKADTVTYRVGLPLFVVNQIAYEDQYNGAGLDSSQTPAQPEILIGTGGAVSWAGATLGEHDTVAVTFDDAALPYVAAPAPLFPRMDPFIERFYLCGFTDDCTQAGSLKLTVFPGLYAGRYFPVPGTYEYTVTSNRLGSASMRARIVVVDETSAP